MTLTPQMRALGAMLATAVLVSSPLAIGALLHAEWAHEWVRAKTPVYILWATSFVLSYGAYLLVYRSFTSRSPHPAAGSAFNPELNLVVERLPKAAWLALGPPVLIVLALWWITTHRGELPWRYGWDGPLDNNPLYRKMVTQAVLACGATTWIVFCGFAVWFGMSRAYQFRRALLLNSVFNQWVALTWTLDAMLWDTFRVPVAAATVTHALKAAGICILVLKAVRLNKLYNMDRTDGAHFYFDPHDPAYRGPRGLNLASIWFQGLAASGIALLIVAAWLLRWSHL